MDEVSHVEIYGLLKELKAELDMSLRHIEDERERAEKQSEEIFARLNLLEKRVGQIIILALAFTVAIPVCVELATGRLLHFGTPVHKSRQLNSEIITAVWTPPPPQSLP
ncbi:MAG: hypothetical protein QGG29_08100 [Prochlorococcaceae cyanobacterium ETNP18_MAG_17]|jgi:hypothetical protein|nr:hypothetical protein [Prochlorococcaceae cyanobacterium ETNP18_MAG_17]